MENMAGFRSIKKPVMSDISEMKINPIAITDIPFMPKMQKRAKHTEVKLPFSNNKSLKNTCCGEVNSS